ncbi:uncharacterized protein KIAA2012 homolog isoform X3 [Punica granatum]|uniref:Uncharacterized protein KIAA2012 homolog isoform X3 n=1 Tax=Punica granatum TaxID=22663 RepID=A0A6P8DTC3_PUNGR|nr:uncharacterized protein KIAA2012 homolog isoform X3 [Punica granatum]
MIRKVLEFSLRNSSRRIPGQIRRQKPSYLSSRKEFSTASPQNASPKPGTASKPPESGNSFSKVVIGGIAVGAAVLAAHQAGYLDQILHKEKQDSQAEVGLNDEDRSTASQKAKPFSHKVEEKVLPSMEVRDKVSPNKENVKEKGESHSIASTSEALHDRQNEILPRAQDKSETAPSEDKVLDEEKLHASSIISNDHSTATIISAEEKLDRESPDAKISVQPSEAGQVSHASTDGSSTAADTEVESPVQHILEEDRKEDSPSVIETATPLLDAYHLRDKDNEKSSVYLNGNGESEKAFASAMEELGEAAASKDGKLILDFLQAIHAAELRQAELDARAFTEEKKAMKEKYEKELKDAIARELMHAEEAALLDKELKRERAKAAAAIKSLQQKLEEKHKMELAEKEKEAELKLKKVEELSKAEMSAAIAREKASQVEKMAEANLHINALCMAFYARSEEARQSHSVHKLALGALALEDALSKGLPIKVEIEALRTYLNGIDKDSVLDLVLSSLPEETIDHGTDTVLQLNQQFDTLKGTLRHFSLIPPGGGGILAHSLAHIASWLKVREANYSGNGIESVISQVESYLAEGKLAEAADALEEGVKDSRAVEVISSWVKQARNRAIAEQALTLLQSYATSISLT